MTTVSYLDVELRARADQYAREHNRAATASRRYGDTASRAYDRASQAAQRYDRASKSAANSGDRLGGAFSRAANSAAILEGPLGGVAGRLSSISAGLSAAGPLMLGVGIAAGGLAAAVTSASKAYAELEVRQAKTQALLNSTGYSAGFTASQLDSMARGVALNTLASTADIREAIDVLLTFRSVSGETFRRTISLSQDMSVIMGGNAKSAALQLGKALEDPVRGLTTLSRSGVTFTQAEKDMVKQLVEGNQVLEAQGMILDKVAGQLGGTGEAAAGGLTGKVDTLTQRWEEMLETLGKTGPIQQASGAFITGLTRTLEDFTHLIDPSTMDQQKLFDDLVRQREEARKRLAAVNFDDLISVPLPGVYDQNDWWNDQRLMGSLNEQLRAMQDQRVEEQKAASAAQRKAEAAAEAAAQERDAAKIAEQRAAAEERIAKAMESQLGKASFGNAGKSLYNDIFGIRTPQRKTDGPVEGNYYFGEATRAAQAQINSGNAVNSDGWLNRMRAVYDSAMQDTRHNYDVEGMREVIKLMEDKAIVKFGDLQKAVTAQREQGGSYSITAGGKTINGKTSEERAGSILEIAGETINLSMAAETAEAMGKEVRSWLETAQKGQGGTNHGTVTLKVDNGKNVRPVTLSGPDAELSYLADVLSRAASGA
ncbi:phage tail length tape measure family protein [Marinobacterium lutimaris]|uniref:Prophage tail length tape measure protein n=1 Tax=Marinobacterium lutimaris TaxID=568106 RepID=A0A1H5XS97_9GAMM|nr:phage tail length tape measure family protein [Marinobacterium lutimaris]SEG14558.1 Prophage tail length tape measure protein [Marinobacterium lutimaris]